jgi:COP9 signalosome complex subunit 1
MLKYKPKLQLDIHLHEHVEALYQKIRNKALIQYFSPFISVDLNTMAGAFNTNVAGLEKELSRLIMDGSISARIDSHNKVMVNLIIVTMLEIVCSNHRSEKCYI